MNNFTEQETAFLSSLPQNISTQTDHMLNSSNVGTQTTLTTCKFNFLFDKKGFGPSFINFLFVALESKIVRLKAQILNMKNKLMMKQVTIQQLRSEKLIRQDSPAIGKRKRRAWTKESVIKASF